MSTVRIYKVAELLDTTSQEVLALLKKEHGIELKSASSTVEEVVARSFVERTARQRGITLPGGDMFADHAAPAKPGAKKGPALKKPAEPPKPTAPVLGPPRLVKTVRPATHAPADETHASAAMPAAPAAVIEAPPEPPPHVPEPVAEEPPLVEAAPEPAPVADAPVESPAPIEEPPVEAQPEVAASAERATPAASQQPAGRFVPPTLRLRIEEPGRTPQPARPTTPAKRPAVTQPRIVQPPPANPPAATRPASAPGAARPGMAARPGTPGART